jgi:Flp pilus assembly protein TadG
MAPIRLPKCQRGSTVVEFALIGSLLITLLLAITGFGHWIFTLEMVAEATRAGARMAAVCDVNANTIKTAIQNKVPQLSLQAAQIALDYVPNGCNKSNCQAVRVSLTGATYSPWFPAGATVFTIPPFTTSLPRESLESVNAAGDVNPTCS